MNTIKQSTNVDFHCIEISDAVALLPLMDDLVESINDINAQEYYRTLSNEEKEKYWMPSSPHIPYAKKVYQVLLELGFVANNNILPEGKELRMKRIKEQ